MRTCAICKRQIAPREICMGHNWMIGPKLVGWSYSHLYCVDRVILERQNSVRDAIYAIGANTKRSLKGGK
jgi:hypothetical protein